MEAIINNINNDDIIANKVVPSTNLHSNLKNETGFNHLTTNTSSKPIFGHY